MQTDRDKTAYGYKALAIAALTQALIDLKSSDLILSLDAVLFLTGDDFPLWAEAVGAPDLDGLYFVTSGKARKVKVNRIIHA